MYVEVFFTAHEAYSYVIYFLRLTRVSLFVPSIASLFVWFRLLYVYLSSDARDTLEECTGHLGVVCCCAGYISSHLRLLFQTVADSLTALFTWHNSLREIWKLRTEVWVAAAACPHSVRRIALLREFPLVWSCLVSYFWRFFFARVSFWTGAWSKA